MQILAATAAKRMPWKNGLGTTLELATDASTDQPAWSWRLSIADVPARAVCSTWNGMRRAILCLEGEGLLLERAHGTDAVPLIGSGLEFEGEDEVVCVPLGSSVRDVNLIFDRSRWEGTLRLVRATAGAIAGEMILVHVPRDSPCDIAVDGGDACVLVRRGETLLTSGIAVVPNLDGGTCILAALSKPSISRSAGADACCGGEAPGGCGCCDAGSMNESKGKCCGSPTAI